MKGVVKKRSHAQDKLPAAQVSLRCTRVAANLITVTFTDLSADLQGGHTQLAAQALLALGRCRQPSHCDKLEGLSAALQNACKYRRKLHKKMIDEDERLRESMQRQQALQERIMHADMVMREVSSCELV